MNHKLSALSRRWAAGALPLALLLLVSACNTAKERVAPAATASADARTAPGGSVVSKTFSIRPFSKLRLGSEANIELTQGSTESVTLEADNQRLANLVMVSNSGDTLVVRQAPNVYAGRFTRFVVRITLKSVDNIRFDGTGGSTARIATTNTLSLPAFRFTWLTTGKEAGIFSINAPAMTALVSGGTVNNFSDGVTRVSFYKSTIAAVKLRRFGFGTFDGYYGTLPAPYGYADLATETAQVVNEGLGDVFLKANQTLDLTNTGSGTIYYRGPATVQARNTGGGTIKPL